MSTLIPYKVTFDKVIGFSVDLDARDDDDAIAQSKTLCETLTPELLTKVKAHGARFENFEAESQLKEFRVTVEAKAIYVMELEAIDRQDAEEKAEDRWNSHGPEDFSFEDFEDVHFQAEEVER